MATRHALARLFVGMVSYRLQRIYYRICCQRIGRLVNSNLAARWKYVARSLKLHFIVPSALADRINSCVGSATLQVNCTFPMPAYRPNRKFLAHMSHEIWHPMKWRAVGLTELLGGTPPNSEQRNYVDTHFALANRW